ncbi:hypothetical protein FRC06_005744 [Ceratobasidium sp. 370]|nr:hypothetical protein FRC06_005744 [Ceratobasidium sp. 370]
MAEYLVTKGCLVDVLDRAFDNPLHESCYEVGGCQNCVRQRELDEAKDQLAAKRSVKREETELDIKMYDPETELKRKTRVKRKNERVPKDVAFIKTRLLEWREQEYQKLLVDFDIPIDAFLADKFVQRIAKFKVKDLESFSSPDIDWSAPVEWKTKVLESVQAIEQDLNTQRERGEVDKRKAAEAKKRANEEARRKEQEERACQREFERQQKARKTSQQLPLLSAQAPGASTSTGVNQPLVANNTEARLAQGRAVYKVQIAVPRHQVPPIQTTGTTVLARSYPSPITPGASVHPSHVPVARTQLPPPLLLRCIHSLTRQLPRSPNLKTSPILPGLLVFLIFKLKRLP